MAFWSIGHILNKIFDSATSALGVKVTGSNVAHDAPSTANPVLTGYVAESTTPAAVADGDLSQDAGTLYGARFVNLRTAAGGEYKLVNTNQLGVTILNGSGTEPNIGGIAAGDGAGGATNGFSMLAAIHAINSSGTLDRWRNNTEGTLLASAARTTSVSSVVFLNYNSSVASFFIDVTAKAAATTLNLSLNWIDPVTMNPRACGVVTAIPAAVGQYVVQFGLGAIVADFATSTYGKAVGLQRNLKVTVDPSDANSVTYSVGYALNV